MLYLQCFFYLCILFGVFLLLLLFRFLQNLMPHRPTTTPALAVTSQRVWHGAGSGSRSKLPAVVTQDRHAVPPEYRRKRAVDSFFEQQQRAIEAKSKRELKSGGSGGGSGGGGRWMENQMQRFRLKNGIFDPEDGKSCFYLRSSKEVHAVQLPTFKTDCPRNCVHANLPGANPNEPCAGHVHCETAGNTNSFFNEPLTRVGRERWTAREGMRADHIARHESSYPLRRLRDRSAQTLDNQFRQELDPQKPNQTVMASVLAGTFYDAPPVNTNHGKKNNSRTSTRPSSASIFGDAAAAASRKGDLFTPNFLSMNKKNVRSASTVVSICKNKGIL